MPAFTVAELRDIQGFGIAGFNKDHQATAAVAVPSAASGRALLGWLATQVADAYAVTCFNAAFSDVKTRTHVESLKATWTAAMVSSAGFAALGDQMNDLPTGTGPAAFKSGMAGRASQIGDTEEPNDQPSQWVAPFRPGANQVHILVVVAADDICDLDRQLLAVHDQVRLAGCSIVFEERGATLPPPLTGHEHFGFKDGVSQPVITGDTPPLPGTPPAVPAGEFVLGYQNAIGATVGAGTRWADGSFVVFRRLHQNVAAFRQLQPSGVKNADPAVADGLLGAKMIGRWPSGAPIEEFPTADPGSGQVNNAFTYQGGDPDGQRCPVWAHIRKANPRDELDPSGQPANSGQRRMIRRGIPYGPPLTPGILQDDAIDRGLHFFAVVSDLARQFEFVQRTWMNNPNFPIGSTSAKTQPYEPPAAGTPAGGPDPVVGEHTPSAVDTLVQASGSVPFTIGSEIVSVTAGEYFFLPSIAMLTALGTAPQS